MTTFLASVACTYSLTGSEAISTSDSETSVCEARTSSRIENLISVSVTVAASSSHDDTETLFIKNLEVAARCKAECSHGKEPQPFQAASVESEFMIDKKDELFRRDYIDRLTMMKIIRPQNQKSHQTLAIFDWDDTLLPTSYLYYVGLDNIRCNPQMQTLMGKIDKSVAKLLDKAARVAKTYIITNAMKDWVETSSEMYLPLTHQIIKSKEITVVSARSEYEEAHPNDPKQWKMDAFLKLKESLQNTITTNIICLGDNEIEMNAAQALGSRFHHSMVKTVKFKQQPRPEELIKQHDLVLQKFDQIYTTLKSLSIKLEKKN